jgi:hypothetical protein
MARFFIFGKKLFQYIINLWYEKNESYEKVVWPNGGFNGQDKNECCFWKIILLGTGK